MYATSGRASFHVDRFFFFFFFLLPPGLSMYVNVEANIALKCDDPGGGGIWHQVEIRSATLFFSIYFERKRNK